MEPWFGAGLRTSMAVPVEKIVHGTVAGRRKCFYDEEGQDCRLSVPGVRWADLKKIRRDILESLRSNCQEAFDKIYEQIVENRRVSMNQHVLPTIKTPAVFKKTKSCTDTLTQLSPQPKSPPPSPPPSTMKTPLNEVFTPRSVAHMNSNHLTKPTRMTDDAETDESDEENVQQNSVATTSTRESAKSPRRNKKSRQAKLDVLVCKEIDKENVQQNSVATTSTRESAKSPRRNKKSRQTKLDVLVCKEIDKENVENDVSAVNTRGSAKSSLGNAKSRNAKVDVLVCEEIVTGRVTRSSVRGRNPKSPLATLSTTSKRTTRSRTRAAKNAKTKASLTDPDQAAGVEGTGVGHLQHQEKDVEQPVVDKSEKEQVVEVEVGGVAKKARKVPCNSISTRRSEYPAIALPREAETITVLSPGSPQESRRSSPHTTSPTTTSPPHPLPSSPPVASTHKSPPLTVTPDAGCCMTPPTESTTAKEESLTSNVIPIKKSPSLCVKPVTPPVTPDAAAISHTETPPFSSCVTPVTTQLMLGSTLTSDCPPTEWYTAATSLSQSPPNGTTTASTTASHTALLHCKLRSLSGDYHTPKWSRSVAAVDEPVSPALNMTETKSPESNAVGEWRERRSGSSLGGKRLRSVSLEKLSLTGLEVKKISLCVPSPDTLGNDGAGDGRVLGVSPTDENIDSAPAVLNNEDVNISKESEDSSSPYGSEGSGDHTASVDSLDIMETTPSVGSEPLSSGSDKTAHGSSTEEGAYESPTHLQHPHTQPASMPAEEESVVGSGSCARKSPVLSLKKTKASPWAFLSHKSHFHDLPQKAALLPVEGRPATFLSPKASPRGREGMGKVLTGVPLLAHSFLPKGSPQQLQKSETNAARHRKLMEHMQRKREEEEQRKRELEERKQQEIEQRKRRNAERAQRVAEKRRLEEERRLKLRKKAQENEHDDLLKKHKQLKENERKEKSKKNNDRMAAARARKRQEEEQKAKKLKQLEEDRKMAEELHKQRLEKEEDERQVKRAERLKQERERQQLKEAEERERLAQEAEEKHDDPVVLPKVKPLRGDTGAKNNAFKQLLASTCTVGMPVSAGHFISEWKNKAHINTSTVTKNQPTLHKKIHNISLEKCRPPLPVTPNSSKEDIRVQTTSDMNTTFTVDVSSTDAKEVFVTPNKPRTSTSCDSYKMTPAEPRSSNYDIDDLSSGDSTDEEDHPKKPIPSWAATTQLKPYMLTQEERVYACLVDPSAIFPSTELLREVDLARIFKMKRKRFYHRTSSARWDSPVLLKKGKFDGFSVSLV